MKMNFKKLSRLGSGIIISSIVFGAVISPKSAKACVNFKNLVSRAWKSIKTTASTLELKLPKIKKTTTGISNSKLQNQNSDYGNLNFPLGGNTRKENKNPKIIITETSSSGSGIGFPNLNFPFGGDTKSNSGVGEGINPNSTKTYV